MTDRDILLSLCGSLTLCDHMGDVADDVYEALKRAGVTVEDDGGDWNETVANTLHKMGVKTLYDTELSSET